MNTWKAFERLYKGTISRRDFMESMLAVGIVPYIPRQAFGLTNEAALSCLTWSRMEGGELAPGFAHKYSSPQYSYFNDETHSINDVRCGASPDVIYPSHNMLSSWKESGLIPLDETRLIHLADISPELLALPGSTDSTGRYFVPLFWGATSFIYRSDLMELPEESWAELFHPKHYGRVEMWDSVEGIIPAANLALGQTENIYNPGPEHLERVQELLNRSCRHFRLFKGSEGNNFSAFKRGDIHLAYSWSGHAALMKRAGFYNFKWAQPKEGTPLFVCGLACGPTKKNQQMIYDFINAATSPEAGEFIANAFGYVPANIKAATRVKDADPMFSALNLQFYLKSYEEVTQAQRMRHLRIFNSAKALA